MINEAEAFSRDLRVARFEGGNAPDPVAFGFECVVFVLDFIQLQNRHWAPEIVLVIGLLPAKRDRLEPVALFALLVELSNKITEFAGAKDEFVFGSISMDHKPRFSGWFWLS